MKIEDYLKNHPAAAEYGFLFACCQAVFAGTSVRYPDDIRPEVFLKIVQHHKLIPQLYPILKKHCENVSDEVLRQIQELFKQHNLHILKLSGELAHLSKLFAARNISWVSIKGPALSTQLYGNIAARQAHDLDILVKEVDLEKATNLLIESGYIPTYDPAEFNSTQIRFWRKYYKDAFFTHKSRNIYVELHWRIVTDSQIFDDIDFFEGVQCLTVGNHNIPVLDNRVNALYLCYHGGYHAWRRLFWLWDMAQIIRDSDEESIGKIATLISKYGLTEIFGQTVYLSGLLFGVKMPDQLKNIPVATKVTKKALHFILDQNMSALQQMLLNFTYQKHILPPRSLKPVLAVALINPLHWKTIRLPEQLFFLYYFLRPVAVIIRGIRKK